MCSHSFPTPNDHNLCLLALANVVVKLTLAPRQSVSATTLKQRATQIVIRRLLAWRQTNLHRRRCLPSYELVFCIILNCFDNILTLRSYGNRTHIVLIKMPLDNIVCLSARNDIKYYWLKYYSTSNFESFLKWVENSWKDSKVNTK